MTKTLNSETLWMLFGFAAQVPFFMRFVWQWIVSERRGEVVVPVAFWYWSLVGGIMLTVYTLFRHPILAPCQAAGLVVYVRNLVLYYRSKASLPAREPSSEAIPSRLGDDRKAA